ncbi:hypothetical protein [Streptomyces mayteni]
MRKSIRLALPAAAAVMALALTACGEDEESNDNGAGDAGASETTGGGEGGDDAAADDAAAGGEAPASADLDGMWYVDLENAGSVNNIDFMGGTVTFWERGLSGSTCDGTYADGAITLDTCGESLDGEPAWSDMSATVAAAGDGAISVTWSGGQNETYYLQDLGDIDMGELEDMDLSELEDSLAELEDLEAELGG